MTFGTASFIAGDDGSYLTNGQAYAPAYLSGHDIAYTEQDELYRSEHFHEALFYQIPVRGGACYEVRLHFAEIYFNAPGGRPEPAWGRIFDLILDGQLVMDDYNILKQEGGALRAAVYTFEVCKAEGDEILTLEFPARSNNGKVSAIEILKPCGGNCETSLPVELVDFRAKEGHDCVELNWATAREFNNAGFVLEYAPNGRNFQAIGFVEGQGNSDTLIRYRFEDRTARKGARYYRLKQVDYNGSYTYSSLTEFHPDQFLAQARVFPNPVVPSEPLTVQVSGLAPRETVHIRLRSLGGQLLWEHVSHSHGGHSWQEQLFLPPELPAGTYLLELWAGSQRFAHLLSTP